MWRAVVLVGSGGRSEAVLVVVWFGMCIVLFFNRIVVLHFVH